MGKKVDWMQYVGKKYNHLMICEILPDSRKGDGRMCRCVCDCEQATIVDVPIKRVLNNHKQSCGCANCVNLLGEQYGQLTVIAKTDERYHKQVVWQCLCTCGNTAYVASGSLRRGLMRSCGCLGDKTRRENARRGTNFHVMGTNLCALQRSDTDCQRNNTSGYTGVSYDPVRDCYIASLEMMGHRYRTRHSCFQNAVRSRAEMKQIHLDFLAWWKTLSKSEQVQNAEKYRQELLARKAQLRARCDQYMRTTGDGMTARKDNS